MQRLFSTIFLSFTLLLLLSTNSVFAADYTLIYGGGAVACAKTDNTPTPAPIQNFADINQTKGGLPVNQPVQTTTTPNTGPEALSIIGLIPAAAAGFWLRKRTK